MLNKLILFCLILFATCSTAQLVPSQVSAYSTANLEAVGSEPVAFKFHPHYFYQHYQEAKVSVESSASFNSTISNFVSNKPESFAEDDFLKPMVVRAIPTVPPEITVGTLTRLVTNITSVTTADPKKILPTVLPNLVKATDTVTTSLLAHIGDIQAVAEQKIVTPAANPLPPVVAPLPPIYQVGVIKQDDQSQYANLTQYARWHGSVCSAATITSVLVGYGYPIKLGDVLNMMRDEGTINPWIGLADNNGFGPLARQFGLQANIDRNSNLDEHFNSIMAHLQAHQPVIVNLKDGYLYPTGHFVVAFNVNKEGFVGIMDPDWHGKYPAGLQAWPVQELKTLFSRTLLSVSFSR